MAHQFSPERKRSETGAGPPRQHYTIEERSEPVSPSGSDEGAPRASELTAALRKQPPRDRKANAIGSSNGLRTRHDSPSPIPSVVITSEEEPDMTETTPLLPRERLPSYRKPKYDAEANTEEESPLDASKRKRSDGVYSSLMSAGSRVHRVVLNPKTWNMRSLTHNVVVRPASMLPSVFLGLLLNLLDALSYGIILFPLGEEVFADLGSDGVSMFYVSCIISQLVYSTGSIFKGGVGSEMVSQQT